MWFHKTPKHQTSFGEFVRDKYDWTGQVTIGGKKVEVEAEDVNGEPNPQLLQWLLYIDQHLMTLERTAQIAVPQLQQYKLVVITESDDESESGQAGEFTFIFDALDEDATDSILVDFKAGQVISWEAVE